MPCRGLFQHGSEALSCCHICGRECPAEICQETNVCTISDGCKGNAHSLEAGNASWKGVGIFTYIYQLQKANTSLTAEHSMMQYPCWRLLYLLTVELLRTHIVVAAAARLYIVRLLRKGNGSSVRFIPSGVKKIICNFSLGHQSPPPAPKPYHWHPVQDRQSCRD